MSREPAPELRNGWSRADHRLHERLAEERRAYERTARMGLFVAAAIVVFVTFIIYWSLSA